MGHLGFQAECWTLDAPSLQSVKESVPVGQEDLVRLAEVGAARTYQALGWFWLKVRGQEWGLKTRAFGAVEPGEWGGQNWGFEGY